MTRRRRRILLAVFILLVLVIGYLPGILFILTHRPAW